ncbi:hypothetical protein BY996DRAFT_7251949 [Phakopsora pachyrhizi]|nr:hypothetical protein BY996DRAFT_7251949 [Phakopsora pachyrhizi]
MMSRRVESEDGGDVSAEFLPIQTITLPIPLPRPYHWRILPVLSSLDLLNSFGLIVLLSIHTSSSSSSSDGGNSKNLESEKSNGERLRVDGERSDESLRLIASNQWLIFSWILLRSILLMVSSCSRRIRSLGWVFASTGMVSVLILLWCTNEFIQTNDHRDSLRGFLVAIEALLVVPMINWFGFLFVVGVSTRRNPFNRKFLGLGDMIGSDRGHWEEQPIEESGVLVLEEDDDDDGCQGTTSAPSARDLNNSQNQLVGLGAPSLAIQRENEEEEEEEYDDDDDLDEIVDLPIPSVTVLTPGPPLSSSGSLRIKSSLNKRSSWNSHLPPNSDPSQSLRRGQS